MQYVFVKTSQLPLLDVFTQAHVGKYHESSIKISFLKPFIQSQPTHVSYYLHRNDIQKRN